MESKKPPFMPLSLWLYVPGLVFFIYLFFAVFSYSAENSNNLIVSGLHLIDFGVHEVSHIVVAFLPPLAVAAAGSIGEIGFTFLILYATLKAKSYFATVFAALWVMLGFMSVGRYMADARAQVLPLMGPGDAPQHDWNFIFSQLGWLNADTIIGGTVSAIGVIIGACGLLLGSYLIILKVIRRA